MAVYSGSTPKYLLRLKNETGVQLDPSNLAQVTEVKVFINNAINGNSIAKFILNEVSLPTGYSRLTIKDLGDDDVRVLMVLTSAMTNAAEGNSNEIQVNIHIPDPDITGGTRIIIRRGRFHEILKART
jgi:hypothetical protein